MLEVYPIRDKSEQERICADCGVVYMPEMLAYSAYADGSLIGVCQFRMEPRGGVIYTLDAIPGNEDFQPMFVMGRATLSFMETCGADTAYFDAPVRDSVLVGAIGFRPDEQGRYSVDLRGFFDHPCQHDKAE